MSGYTIAPDRKSITCHHCGSTSHNLNDVRERYCGRCRVFHDDLNQDDHIAAQIAPMLGRV